MSRNKYIKKLNTDVKYYSSNKIRAEKPDSKVPDFLKNDFQRAKSYINTGRYDEAREILIRQLNTKNKKYAMLELGKLEAQLENIKEAKRYYEMILKLDSKDDYAMFEIGKIEYVLGNYKEAKDRFEKILEIRNDPITRFQLAKTEYKLGNASKARIHYKALSKTILDDIVRPYALLELARLEACEGNIEEARRIFTYLGESNRDEYAYRLLAMMEFKNGNYLEALKIINSELKNNREVDEKLILALSKELNVFFDYDYNDISLVYRNKQILDYDEESTINHIIERHFNGIEKSNFNKNLDPYMLFNEAKTMLAKENKVKNLAFNDIYIIPYSNIGEYGEEYLKVVTLPNTKNIITMHPLITDMDVEDEDVIETKKKLSKKFKDITKKIL